MSISSAVVKEEFTLDQAAMESECNEQANQPKSKKTEAKEKEVEVSAKNLDATQLYLGEIGF